jgi:hypothetical protein
MTSKIARHFTVSEEYGENFKKAYYTFKHQLVFDIKSRRSTPLNPYSDETEGYDFSFAGQYPLQQCNIVLTTNGMFCTDEDVQNC